MDGGRNPKQNPCMKAKLLTVAACVVAAIHHPTLASPSSSYLLGDSNIAGGSGWIAPASSESQTPAVFGTGLPAETIAEPSFWSLVVGSAMTPVLVTLGALALLLSLKKIIQGIQQRMLVGRFGVRSSLPNN